MLPPLLLMVQKRRIAGVLVGAASFLVVAIAFAASVGPQYPSSAVDDGGASDAWSGPSNATASDNAYATVTFTAQQWSNGLQATGFDFSTIPDGSQIDGIVVEIERKTLNNISYNHSISLIVDGVVQGTSTKQGAFMQVEIEAEGEKTDGYGSSSDTWNLTLSVADVKNANFGVQAKYMMQSGNSFEVDAITMTVHYTPRATVTLTVDGVSCTDTCPQDFGDCGYGKANGGGTYDISITFSQSVTGFTSGDITVVNGTVQSLVGSGTDYTATITSDCTNCLVEVSVGADVVNEGNDAAGPLWIPWGELYYKLCDIQCGGCLNVPTGYSVVLQSTETTLVCPIAQAGSKDIRIKKGTSRLADLWVHFNPSLTDCELMTLGQENQTSLLHGFQTLDIAVGGSYALYVPKIEAHDQVRVCMNKTTLNCGSSDSWSFLANEAGTITATNGGFDTTGITVAVVGDYWKISGLTSTSGQGESSGDGGGDDAIPFFPWWAYPIILLAGAWVLQREGVWGYYSATINSSNPC